MTKYTEAQYAFMVTPPVGEVTVPDDLIRKAMLSDNIGTTAIQVDKCDMRQKQIDIPPSGVAHVEMNASARAGLASGAEGLLSTSSLAGCTGLAGFAKHNDGRTSQFIGHFSPAAERVIINKAYWEPLHQIGSGKNIITPWASDTVPTPYNMSEFYIWVTNNGASEVEMLIAYGGRDRPYEPFDVRHYFVLHNTTIQSPTSSNEPPKRSLILPYEGGNHSLAAGRIDGKEGIFWDGVKVDFDSYLG